MATRRQLIVPGDPRYEAARRLFFWNPTTDKRPAMIAQCEAVDDVARAIEFARRHHLIVAVRSGGHSTMSRTMVTVAPTLRAAR